MAQFVVLFAVVAHQHEDRQDEDGREHASYRRASTFQRENPGDRSEAVWAIAVNFKQCIPDSSSDRQFAFHVSHLT